MGCKKQRCRCIVCVGRVFFVLFSWGGGGALKGGGTEFIWAYVPAQKETGILYGEYMCIDLISFNLNVGDIYIKLCITVYIDIYKYKMQYLSDDLPVR